MEVSGHQLDFILLHIWQEIPHAPTPTVSSTELPHNARLEPYMWEKELSICCLKFGALVSFCSITAVALVLHIICFH